MFYPLSQTYLRFRGLLRESAASPPNHEAAGEPTNRKPRRLGWALLAWVIIQAVESSGPGVRAPPSWNINICSAPLTLKWSQHPPGAREIHEKNHPPTSPSRAVPLSVQASSWCQETLIWNQSQSIRSAGKLSTLITICPSQPGPATSPHSRRSTRQSFKTKFSEWKKFCQFPKSWKVLVWQQQQQERLEGGKFCDAGESWKTARTDSGQN